MSLNLWSVLLIAFASQNIFLIVVFMVRPAMNKTAARILLLLLTITLLILISNIISATYLYRSMPAVAGFARGMVFLFGPLLYLYTVALLEKSFIFKPAHLLHFLPYGAAVIVLLFRSVYVTDAAAIGAIDAMMDGGVAMEFSATMWFVCYAVHLSVYFKLIHRRLERSVHDAGIKYLVALDQRVFWLKKMGIILFSIALVFMGIVISIAVTGTYSMTGNFIYTLVLAGFVYLIAYQQMVNHELVLPGFSIKYQSQKTDDHQTDAVFSRLVELFEQEKIFKDSDLSLTMLAQRMDVPVHLVSQVINTRFQKSFTNLLHEYRIREFTQLARDTRFAHYSIMGIAYEVGYNSKSAFNTAFKKQMGLTPSAYMK